MARRSVTGQLNMFELLNSLEEVPVGEVEMVSLMPVFDEELDEKEAVAEATRKAEDEAVVEVHEKVVVPVEKEVRETKVIPTAEAIHKEENQQAEKQQEEIELQEVSEKTEVEPQSLSREADKPVMSRSYEVDGEKIEVAYLNYNKVRITRTGGEPEVKVFASSKEAVDYYVQMMQEWKKDEE